MANTTSTTQPRRFIKRQAVEQMTGLSCSEIYRRIAAGTFPAQVTCGFHAHLDTHSTNTWTVIPR